MAARPKSSQHRFDHMRQLIRKIKDRALIQNDLETCANAELLNALLLLFVEPLIVEDSIIVQESKIWPPRRPADGIEFNFLISDGRGPQSTNRSETHKNGRFVSMPNSLAITSNTAETKGMRRIGVTLIKVCGMKNEQFGKNRRGRVIEP